MFKDNIFNTKSFDLKIFESETWYKNIQFVYNRIKETNIQMNEPMIENVAYLHTWSNMRAYLERNLDIMFNHYEVDQKVIQKIPNITLPIMRHIYSATWNHMKDLLSRHIKEVSTQKIIKFTF